MSNDQTPEQQAQDAPCQDDKSPDSSPDSPPVSDGVVAQLWRHPWGRILMAAMTVAVVFWALRETAYLTGPLFAAAQSILIPLAIGFTIAYILSPMVDRLNKWGIPRSIGTTILFIFMSIIGALFLILLLPSVVRQGGGLGETNFHRTILC